MNNLKKAKQTGARSRSRSARLGVLGDACLAGEGATCGVVFNSNADAAPGPGETVQALACVCRWQQCARGAYLLLAIPVILLPDLRQPGQLQNGGLEMPKNGIVLPCDFKRRL